MDKGLRRWFPLSDPTRKGAGLRVFCIHGAGAGASTFAPLVLQRSPALEIHPLEFPGRESRLRENPYRSLPIALQEVSDLLLDFTDRPYVVLGHSFGGLMAFEIAKRIERSARAGPTHCVVVASSSPRSFENRARKISNAFPFSNWIAAIINTAKRHGRLSLCLNYAIMAPLAADISLLRQYRSNGEPLVRTKLLVYRGSVDRGLDDRSIGEWSSCAEKRGFRAFQGDHWFIRNRVAEVAMELEKDCL